MPRSKQKPGYFIFLILAMILIYGGLHGSKPFLNNSINQNKLVPEVITGKCVSVTDGDTIKVFFDNREVKIRLYGIDCPEKNQDFGSAAKKCTSRLAFGKELKVEKKDVDRYGRLVGWVTLPDGTILNEELIREGYAWWYERYAPTDTKLCSLETEARDKKIGLWSAKHPIPPWDFRRSERE